MKKLAIVFLLLLIPAIVFADTSWRCNGRLIQTGDTKAKVLARCGEPLAKDVVSGDNQVVIEKWVYAESQSFARVLTFVGDRLTYIALESEKY